MALSYEEKLRWLNDREERVKEESESMELNKQYLWETERYRPRLIKDNVKWALGFQARMNGNRIHDDPCSGKLEHFHLDLNQDIVCRTRKFMDAIPSKTSQKTLVKIVKIRLDIGDCEEDTFGFDDMSLNLTAIMVKSILLSLQFYHKVWETEKEPFGDVNPKLRKHYRMLEKFSQNIVVPASLLLTFELFGQKRSSVNDIIINSCQHEDKNEVEKHCQIMKLCLNLTSENEDPISAIVNSQSVQNMVKIKAIKLLVKLLKNGKITNPFANSDSIARFVIKKVCESQIHESNNMDNMPNAKFISGGNDMGSSPGMSSKASSDISKCHTKEKPEITISFKIGTPAAQTTNVPENDSIAQTNQYIIRKNIERQMYECPICNAYFSLEKTKVKRHLTSCLKSFRLKNKDYKCETCNKRFVKKYSLLQHQNGCKEPLQNAAFKMKAYVKYIEDKRKFRCQNCKHFLCENKWRVERHVHSCLSKRRESHH